MGTTYHVKYLDEGSMKATSEKTHEEIEAILKDVNAKMSTYKKDSELSRFNQNTLSLIHILSLKGSQIFHKK